MEEWTLFVAIREFFAGVFFKMFLWCSQLTENEYFDLIYFQECAIREQEKGEEEL